MNYIRKLSVSRNNQATKSGFSWTSYKLIILPWDKFTSSTLPHNLCLIHSFHSLSWTFFKTMKYGDGTSKFRLQFCNIFRKLIGTCNVSSVIHDVFICLRKFVSNLCFKLVLKSGWTSNCFSFVYSIYMMCVWNWDNLYSQLKVRFIHIP